MGEEPVAPAPTVAAAPATTEAANPPIQQEHVANYVAPSATYYAAHTPATIYHAAPIAYTVAQPVVTQQVVTQPVVAQTAVTPPVVYGAQTFSHYTWNGQEYPSLEAVTAAMTAGGEAPAVESGAPPVVESGAPPAVESGAPHEASAPEEPAEETAKVRAVKPVKKGCC